MLRVVRSAHVVIVLAIVACSGTQAATRLDQAALQAGLDSASERLVAALRANASDSLLVLMADDVVLMPPNEPVLKGKAAVRAWYEQFLTQLRTSNLTIADREVFMGGEWATELATFEWALDPVGGGLAVVDRGSYMQIWHREPDGRWLFAREIWNSASPPVSARKEP